MANILWDEIFNREEKTGESVKEKIRGRKIKVKTLKGKIKAKRGKNKPQRVPEESILACRRRGENISRGAGGGGLVLKTDK